MSLPKLADAPHTALGDVAGIVGGGTPSTRNPEYFDGEIPWITPKDLSRHRGRFIGRGARSLTAAGLKSSGAKVIPVGSVLISSRAPVGYLAIAQNPLATNQGFRSLVLRGAGVPAYFYYALRANTPLLLSYSNGTTFAELGTRALQDIRLPIPSVDVQENVAAVLDPIDDKATHCLHRARQLLKLSRALALRARSAATGEAPLEAFAVVLGGGTPPTGDRALWDGEHAWATPKDLTALQVPYLGKTARTLTDAGLGMSTLAPAGSILLSSRATIGAVTLTSAPTAFNQGCTAVVPMRGELTHYLFHELDARVPEIESLANGTTFLEVGKRSLRGLLIPELEAREMRRLSRTLCVLHERAQALAIEARKLEALRDGLAQRLFTVV